MPAFTIQNPPVVHKHQTKANDCWYACIQMLKTWKAGGAKQKPVGQHTMHLHSGLLGHRLTADMQNSKHFQHVLHENNLKCLPAFGVTFTSAGQMQQVLAACGPIMVGGNFGRILRGTVTGIGHWVVVAGSDDHAHGPKLFVHDPWKTQPEWYDAQQFQGLAWYDDDSQVICQ